MNLEKALVVLKEYFGYDSFRDGQDKLIENILLGNDAVGIMPTGAGKSICFQIPSIMFDGVTLVISPLISLMKDQVNSLTQVGIKAAYLNSSLTERQYRTVLQNIKDNKYKIVYVAPERLLVNDFLECCNSLTISMVTIDEAHCLSQWGQDFRPSYMQIIDFIKKLPNRPVISAFTATATTQVKNDILDILKLNNPYVLITGYDRKNLYFEVQRPDDKYEALKEFLADKKDESGVVYCSTRDAVEEVCNYLNKIGFSATRYHAGLSDNERKENQENFIYDNSKIIVATNAFGMGIDKSNVTFVVHFNMPKDIESYYQEAGRAGRDGSNSHCLLLYSGQDVRTNTYIIENSKDKEYENSTVEKMLKARDRERLKIMTLYCNTTECLRAYILRYFGEKAPDFCDNCSSCKTDFETVDITVQSQKILSCVARVRENFGAKMVIDVLRGSKNKRLLSLKFNKLSTYDIMTESEKYIKDIINYLILNDYLFATNDEFPVLKLGKNAKEFLTNKNTLQMKTIKGEKVKSSSKKTSSKSSSKELLQVNSSLLSKLKALRLEIASEQRVPAFVIFSDSTLVDMCMKMPKSEEEFLEVSGVGQVKLEKYGEKFLDILMNFNENSNTETPIIDIASNSIDFTSIETSDEAVTISVISDRINCVAMQRNIKVSAPKLAKWLLKMDYLKEVENEDSKNKIPTSKGIELGISQVLRERETGVNYFINYYNKNAQQIIIDNIKNIIEE